MSPCRRSCCGSTAPAARSPGSETIWREVNRVRDGGKPVVASMGAVAASGGYYVSMSADAIVANAGTITGSIGVVTGKLVARELKDRLGVGSDSVRTNANADAWSINQPFTDEQHAHVEAEADLFYTDFVERVAAGPEADRRGRRRDRPRPGVDRCRRAGARPRRRTRRAAHRDQPRQGAGRARRRRRRPPRQLSRLVVHGHARPKPSSQPAAASLPEAVAALLGRSVAGVLSQAERSLTGVSALWLGDYRF